MAGEDAFSVLGLEPSFDLTPAAIERAYLSRAATLHPDASDPAEAAEAARRMAALNDARKTLKDPELRARALLAARGMDEPGDQSLPEGFLEEMLEVRMEIEGAVSSGDEGERARWVAWAEERRRGHIERTRAHFERTDAAAVRTELNAWRYIERLIEQLDPGYDHQRADLGGG
jgi:curved DNA-binding protein CbpA